MTEVAESAVGSPYRGLAPFGESERDGLLFFGRERETEVVTANLIASRLTVVYGPSGVGKSSLLRAGVARHVRELATRRAVGRGPDLACVVFSSWADDPVGALTDAIGAGVAPHVSPTTPHPPAGRTLADVAEHWSAVLDGDLCLVLDQLEEYFVYHQDRRGPMSLVEQLPELVARPALRANVLLSVREDELARLGLLKDRLPHVFANARRLDRLDREAARAAILGPLQRWNELEAASPPVEIEPELVEAVLAQSTASGDASRIEAPYLQLVMERLWNEEAARGSRVLCSATLKELGGAEAIVREHLDRALSVLGSDHQEAAARMFEHLVTPSGTKIAHRASDLSTFAHLGASEGHDVLEALGRERILRPLDDADGAGRRYEIFHDVLAQAIVDWGHRRDVLAERIAARRRQRRLLAVTAAALVLLGVMTAVTAYALAQRGDARDQTRHARAAALAAGALAELPRDPELSLLLAREAADRDGTREIEEVMRTALQASRARAVMAGHVRGVRAAGFSGGRVVTVDGAGTLRTFTPQASTPVAEEALGGRIRGATLAADGGTLVVARRRTVEVRDLQRSGRSFSFRMPSPVRAVAVNARGDRAAVATRDGRVTVRKATGPVFTARPGFVPSSLAFDEAGMRLAAAAGTRAVVWRLPNQQPVVRVEDRAKITGVDLAADGSLLTTAGADAGARLWNVPGGDLSGVLLGESPLTGVALSPDVRAVVMRSRDGRGRTFEVGGRPISVLAGHRDAVTTAAFSPDGRRLVTGSDDRTVRIWDPGVAPELRLVARPAGCCAALVSSGDGVLVAAGDRAILYRGGEVVATHRHGARVTALARAGSTVVAGGADGRVRLWRTDRGAARTLELAGPVTAVAATPAEVIAAVRGGRIEVLSTDGRRLRSFRESGDVGGLAVSGDGRLLATASADGVARIRDLGTGRVEHELAGHTKALTGVAFSSDGSLLATSSVDHDVRLWSVASGRLNHTLRAHFAVVSGVAFSPDGRWVVSAGPSTAGVWRADTGRFLAYLRGHTGRLVGAGFGAGGLDVVTAAVDGTVRSYRCDICGGLDELVRLADRRLAETGRTLSAAEQRRYLG